MKNTKQRYRIFCTQRNIFFGDKATFAYLKDVRAQLISYHLIDCEELSSLYKLSLADIIDTFEWEVQYMNGKLVDYHTLKLIK